MAKIAINRLDSRLIHGQVAANALRRCGAKAIVIVDDETKNNSFKSQILKAVCPPGTKMYIMTAEEAAAEWQKDELGKISPIMVMFAQPECAYRSYMAGFKYPELQIGGVRDVSEGHLKVAEQIYLTEEEAKMLNDVARDGCDVYIQQVPESKKTSWEPAVKAVFPNV